MQYRLQALSFLFFAVGWVSIAQPTAGTTGLLNTPTANMQQDGTFLFGGNYLPEQLTPDRFAYNTGDYFVNLTFLPFCEINYHCALLLSDHTGKYTEQDRSFALRLRLLKERKYLPSFVIGANDILTTATGNENQNFGTSYIVGTKHLNTKHFKFGTTLGYAFDLQNKDNAKGLFGGISVVHNSFSSLQFMADYDSAVYNIGMSYLIFNHFYMYAFAYDLKYFSGGIQYKVYLKT